MAISVPSNSAEGHARQLKAEIRNFISIIQAGNILLNRLEFLTK